MPSEGAHWSLSAMWEEGQLGRRSAGSFGAHLGEVGVPSPPSRVIPQLHELGGGAVVVRGGSLAIPVRLALARNTPAWALTESLAVTHCLI